MFLDRAKDLLMTHVVIYNARPICEASFGKGFYTTCC
jgi:hypothetical protein